MSEILADVKSRAIRICRPANVPPLSSAPADASIVRRNTVTFLLPGWSAHRACCKISSARRNTNAYLRLACPPGWRVKLADSGVMLNYGLLCRMEVTLTHLPQALARLSQADNLQRLTRDTSAAWSQFGQFVVSEQVVWYGTIYTGYYCRGRALVSLDGDSVSIAVLHVRIPVHMRSADLRIDVLAMQPFDIHPAPVPWTLPERIVDTIRITEA